VYSNHKNRILTPEYRIFIEMCTYSRWGKRNAYRILVGKPEGKRPLGRPKCRWVNNIKMEFREI
jgi:hypothetical protein